MEFEEELLDNIDQSKKILKPGVDYRIKNSKLNNSKRQHSQSFSVSNKDEFNLDDNIRSKDDSHKGLHVNKLPYGKNSRKSRAGMKDSKRGMGGKGRWNLKEMEFDDLVIDRKDPDYDSENDSVNFEENTLVLSEDKFDEMITNYVQEYFENAQTDDFIENLATVNLIPQLSIRIPYLCIVQALQRKPAQCELTSRLLCELIGNIINQDEMQQGFDLVITELKELTIDCPEAPHMVGKFIARAVADHLLPQKYIQNFKTGVNSTKLKSNGTVSVNNNSALMNNALDNELSAVATKKLTEEQLRAFAKAEQLLNLNHAYAQLDTVWGTPRGERPTKMLVAKIKMLLIEYLDAADAIEAERCLRELEAPHFHHEVVFQAIMIVIEKSTEFVCNQMLQLLDSFCASVIITIDQLEQGVLRIYEQMSDIVLDVPAAYIILERFITLAKKNASFFPDQLAQKMPKNTRSRFVSEGNGFLR